MGGVVSLKINEDNVGDDDSDLSLLLSIVANIVFKFKRKTKRTNEHNIFVFVDFILKKQKKHILLYKRCSTRKMPISAAPNTILFKKNLKMTTSALSEISALLFPAKRAYDILKN